MTTVKFDISEAEEAARYLGLSIDKAAKRAILATAIRVVQQITTVVIPGEPRQPVDRSAYRAAWRARPDPDGATVSNSMPYASVVEYGAKAENVKISRAMIIALTGWVMRKGIGMSRTPLRKGTTRAAAKAQRATEARQIAWAIAKGMQKKGIFGGKGLRILEKGLKIVQTAFAQELKAEIEREYG